MRPPHAESPRLKRHNIKTESLRQRCNERNADEIIRFVRDLQIDRQPTSLRLQKKAPLPSIGQHSPPKVGTSDSGFLDRATDSNDSDDDVLDNELTCRYQRRQEAVDPILVDMLTNPRGVKDSTDFRVLSKSLPHSNGLADSFNNNNLKMHTRQTSFIRHGQPGFRTSGNTCQQRAITKQLPPLSRDILPDRPSAPSPSRTPPLSDYGFIEEEPVDFIDLS